MLKKIIFDVKTYFSVNYGNKKRFPKSTVLTYVPKSIKINDFCNIKPEVILSERLKNIGFGTYIGNRTEILNCEKIGNYCSISHDVKIGLDNHLFDGLSTSPLICKMPVMNHATVEHDVLISANVVIMSGIKVGTGSIIGAQSFVNKDVPPYAVVAGIPAKIIKYRFDEEKIEKLLKSKWWEDEYNSLSYYKDAFRDTDLFLKMYNHE
jgi:acetyltransferase-like isoleucine patch superfamily enzyme